jgi:hypothetical protein
MDSVKGVNIEITSDRRKWNKKTCCADPTKWDKGTMTMMMLLNKKKHFEILCSPRKGFSWKQMQMSNYLERVVFVGINEIEGLRDFFIKKLLKFKFALVNSVLVCVNI